MDTCVGGDGGGRIHERSLLANYGRFGGAAKACALLYGASFYECRHHGTAAIKCATSWLYQGSWCASTSWLCQGSWRAWCAQSRRAWLLAAPSLDDIDIYI